MPTDGASRPNVLVVLTDQWRASALGHRGNPDVRTPTLAEFADEGTAVEHACTPKPMCTPARASLLTGTLPHQHRVLYNQLRLPAECTTIAESLRDSGYRTGYIGKWHLDGENSLYVPPERRQGFSYWKGFNTTSHDYWGGQPHFDADGNVEWEEGYQPAIQADITREFLAGHGADDEPFFLTLSWGPPHPPSGGWDQTDPPEEYAAMYDPDELELRPNVPESGIHRRAHLPGIDREQVRADLADYYAYITSLDDLLADILAELDERGLAEETIVVFTSDHGEMVGSHGRHNKGDPYAESINVPLLVRYPGEVPAGRRSEAVASLVDLMPTLLSFCGVDTPAAVQGRDLSGHLRDDPDATIPDSAYVEGWRVENDIPDQADWGPWGQPWRLLRTRRYMLTVDRSLETQLLFDLDEDPYQLENLAGDPDHADTERELREALIDAAYRYDDRRFMTRDRYM